MSARKVKNAAFVLEGINSFATTYYAYYIYFFAQEAFAFGNLKNLMLAACSGFIYVFGAVWGGRLGQRKGYFFALAGGYWTMLISLLAGAFCDSLPAHLAIYFIFVVGMSVTWPNLEAIVSDGETRGALQRLLGIYNLVWAGLAAVAYFTGGAMLEKLGLRSLFIVPAALNIVQLVMLAVMRRKGWLAAAEGQPSAKPAAGEEARPAGNATLFLKLAWLANPFAYVAINTVLPVFPGIAKKLQLSPMLAGVFCSLWMFSRMGAFCLLWRWAGWHYRFGWLAAAYAAMIACFAVILLSSNLWILAAAQIVFGVALGLIYYSSLYYSMDAGDTKGEHGGVHEAAIGAGNCIGPAIGATALWWNPARPESSAWAVSVALLIGLAGLFILRRRGSTGAR